MKVNHDKSISELIADLFSEWESRSESNNVSKLARKMNTSFTTVRNMVNGSVSKPSYYLFDKFLRSVDTEKKDYLDHIKFRYPEFVEAAKRYTESSYNRSNSNDLSWVLRDDTASDVFQIIIGGDTSSCKAIVDKYGSKGRNVISRLLECEIIAVEDDEIKPIGGKRRQLDGWFGVELLKKNAARFSVEHAGETGVRAKALQIRTSKKCINEVRDRIDMMFEDIGKYLEENTDDSGETYTLNFCMLPVD